jgi:hypothetical protein
MVCKKMRLFAVLAAMVSAGCATKPPPTPGEYWKVTTRFIYGSHRSRPVVMKVCQPENTNPKERLKLAFAQMHHGNKDSDNNGCEPAIIKSSGNKVYWKLKCSANDQDMVAMDLNMHGTIIGSDKKYTITTYRDAKVTSAFYSSSENNGFKMGGQSAEWEYLGGSCDTRDRPVRMKSD